MATNPKNENYSRGEDTTLSFDEALEKIEARFIYNLPETELSHIERLFFQIEQAHWFYEVQPFPNYTLITPSSFILYFYYYLIFIGFSC